MRNTKQGFTLIEMSMVIVAIGFLLGVFMIGRDIIHNARLLSITTDIEKFKNSVVGFRSKYKYLPGDMPTATDFWGEDSNCPNTPKNSLPKPETCDGNGDTFVGSSRGNALGGVGNWYETFRFWQHLGTSGFIDGNFAGVASDTAANNIQLGITLPNSELIGNGYSMLHILPEQSRGVFNAEYYHSFIFGKPVNEKSTTYNPALTPTEAYIIDKKVDDGLPGRGFVVTFTPALEQAAECASTDLETSAIYNTEFKEPACALIFISGF